MLFGKFYFPTALELALPHYRAVDDGRDGTAAKRAAVEGRIATARRRLVHVVRPLQIGAENRDVAWRAGCERAAAETNHRIRTGGEQLDHMVQRDLSGMHEVFQRE